MDDSPETLEVYNVTTVTSHKRHYENNRFFFFVAFKHPKHTLYLACSFKKNIDSQFYFKIIRELIR